jgi:hypothetical protein
VRLAFNIFLSLVMPLVLGCLLGCASTYSGSNITIIADELQVHGCKDLGLVIGKSHWGGFTGQEASLEVAKKRALARAGAKGATHVLWLKMKTGVFGASVSGRAYVCFDNRNPAVGNAGDTSKIIPLSKSITKQSSGGSAAVMRFESAGIDSGVSLAVTDVFTNQVQADGKYRIMERTQMNKILGEQGFQNSGACTSTECAVQIGRLLSIEKLFLGSIGKLGDSWVINVRIIDIQTGEILSNISKKVVGKADMLSQAAIQIANELSQ